jgi:outer membrane lipoprotein SlyB
MDANLLKHDPRRTSPLVLAAVLLLILLSAVAIGAFTGVFPRSLSDGRVADVHPSSAVELSSAKPGAVPCFNCGTIASIRAVELRTPPASDGQGASKDGSGTAETILRSAGGIFAGHDFERTLRKRYAYRVTIRMEDGSYRTVSETTPPRFAIGEKVRLVNGTLAASS